MTQATPMPDLSPPAMAARRRAGTVSPGQPRIAVLIPCRNEASTVGKVVADFRAVLPAATTYVYDNNSTDRTVAAALAAGAVIRREPLPGKGEVVRRMFADVEADLYLLVDGDDTYDAQAATEMIALLLDQGLDLVNGRRVGERGPAFRPGHRLGNRLLTGIVNWLFGRRLEDMLSGYKLLSRRFVKSFPALSKGFEIETELLVHALELRVPSGEVAVSYRERPAGSTSKLRTCRDGLRILATIAVLVKEEKPLGFFSTLGALFAATALVLAWPIVAVYLDTGLVPRLPTAVLATGLMLLASLSLVCGLILDTVTRGRRELKRLHYLAQGPVVAVPAGGVATTLGVDAKTG